MRFLILAAMLFTSTAVYAADDGGNVNQIMKTLQATSNRIIVAQNSCIRSETTESSTGMPVVFCTNGTIINCMKLNDYSYSCTIGERSGYRTSNHGNTLMQAYRDAVRTGCGC